ncbi:hypothetical protein DXG01_005656 [Tephrocybe rancida]|nr:hypothetical protein DXG01_005656 [Tephrocybe rancida]
MYHSVALVLAFLPAVINAQTDSPLLSNITQAFSQAQIVPDLLPSFAPTALVNVAFPPAVVSKNSQAVDIDTGTLLTQNQTSIEPALFLVAGDNTTSLAGNQSFVLALVDPDASSPDSDTDKTHFLYFLGDNFSVNSSPSDPTRLVNKGPALLDYVAPSLPAGSPPHRYVLVVYQVTAGGLNNVSSLVNATTSRSGFNLTAFANAANLTSPFAGNYFLVGTDNNTATASPTTTSAIATRPTRPSPTTTLPTTIVPTIFNGAMARGPSVIGIISFVFLVLAREFLGA